MTRIGIPAALAAEDITYRQLDHWVARGYLQPASEANPGTGYHREWTIAELHVARRMSRLVAVGFQPKRAAELARLDTDRLELSRHIVLELAS